MPVEKGRLAGMRRHFITAACIVLASFAGQAKSQGPVGGTKSDAEDDIREVVIRHQMEEWARNDEYQGAGQGRQESAEAKQLRHRVFFISISDKDPSDGFMKRFQNFPRKVKKRSGALLPTPAGGWVEDRETHLPAVLFSADEIHWTSASDVEVRGGLHCASSCGHWDSFIVHLDGGKWKVIRVDMREIY